MIIWIGLLAIFVSSIHSHFISSFSFSLVWVWVSVLVFFSQHFSHCVLFFFEHFIYTFLCSANLQMCLCHLIKLLTSRQFPVTLNRKASKWKFGRSFVTFSLSFSFFFYFVRFLSIDHIEIWNFYRLRISNCLWIKFISIILVRFDNIIETKFYSVHGRDKK